MRPGNPPIRKRGSLRVATRERGANKANRANWANPQPSDPVPGVPHTRHVPIQVPGPILRGGKGLRGGLTLGLASGLAMAFGLGWGLQGGRGASTLLLSKWLGSLRFLGAFGGGLGALGGGLSSPRCCCCCC